MKSFFVIIYDINSKNFVPYDIIPYLEECYHKAENKPKTIEEFKNFVERQSAYQWWSRCEYEIILSDWPNKSQEKKVDVHFQVLLNLDIIAKILMENINDCQ